MGNSVSLQQPCDGNYMHKDEENHEALQKAMQDHVALHKAMQDLERRRDDVLRRVVIEEDEGLQRISQVQEWFSRVEGVECQVNDLRVARLPQTKRLGFCGYSSKNFVPGRSYGRQVSKKLKEVEGLLSKGVFEVVAEKIPASKVEKKHIQTTVGFDRRVRRAWNCLMEDGTRTLGLYGMGGIGKTTVLARINNKFLEVHNKFDVVIWVVVSKDLQYEGIQDQILRRLSLDKEWEQETEEEKAYEIYNILNGKKFVLLLDDLWSKVDLNKVGVPDITQQNGSKIVFTTRSDQVCKDMKADSMVEVVCLSPKESWELFQYVGKLNFRGHQDISEHARIVAGKCNGLPLALSVIGASVSCKKAIGEWVHASYALGSSECEFLLLTRERILPILKFSFDNLDGKVKLCFLYCSLFPEDYEIEKNELIEYWICEGFIDGNRDANGVNKQGHEIIGLLVRAHLLMDGEVAAKVKMHDVIREMALWIATNFGKQREILRVESGVWLHRIPNDISSKVVRRMSFMNNQIAEISCSPKCPKLSTFLLRNNKLVHISGEFFRFMPVLVVLDLSKNEGLTGLPEEISNLGSLQYLNLSHTGIKSLPVGLMELRKLIDLNLDFTPQLQSIIGIAASLPNLQVLKFFDSGVCIDNRLMEELLLLEHLNLLRATIKNAAILESIQGIIRLASRLQSLCLRNMSAAVIILNTVALVGLQIISIVNCKVSEIKIDCKSEESKEILPRTCSRGFNQLSGVGISNLEGPRDLTWLLFAPNLSYLVVEESSSIQEIINREKEMSISNAHPHMVAPFRNLQDLKVSAVEELKRICNVESTVAPFEKLDYLKASGMNELKIICWNPQARLPNLRQCIIQRCPKLPLSLSDRRNENRWKGFE